MHRLTGDHLFTTQSACRNYMDRGGVTRIVEEPESGRKDRTEELWTLLVFEALNRQFIVNGSSWRHEAE
jgi:hypothetical protein